MAIVVSNHLLRTEARLWVKSPPRGPICPARRKDDARGWRSLMGAELGSPDALQDGDERRGEQ